MRTRVDAIQGSGVVFTAQGLGHVRGAALGAEEVGDLAVDASRLGLEARADVDGQVGERSVHDTALGSLSATTYPRGGAEYGGGGEFACVAGFVPVSVSRQS